MIEDGDIHIYRLGAQDHGLARQTFTLMVEVFGQELACLSDAYLDRLLARPECTPPLRRARQLTPG